MEVNKESVLTGYPNIISYKCTKKLTEQMEQNICKITIDKEQATGFFCKIPFPNKDNMLSVFITSNHILNSNFLTKRNEKIQIDIKNESELKSIDLKDRIKYTNKEYDITIIEIKEKDNILNYLELDDIILENLENNNKNKEYINKTIYIIQYPENELSVSYGVLDNIFEDKKYNFIHKCCTKGGSSGSPILNTNNKVIGIHKEGYKKQYNIGLFLYYPIIDFIKLNFKKNLFGNNSDKNININNDNQNNNHDNSQYNKISSNNKNNNNNYNQNNNNNKSNNFKNNNNNNDSQKNKNNQNNNSNYYTLKYNNKNIDYDRNKNNNHKNNIRYNVGNYNKKNNEDAFKNNNSNNIIIKNNTNNNINNNDNNYKKNINNKDDRNYKINIILENIIDKML